MSVGNENISLDGLRNLAVSQGVAGIPSSGEIKLSDFRGITMSDGVTIPTNNISINDHFKGKSFEQKYKLTWRTGGVSSANSGTSIYVQFMVQDDAGAYEFLSEVLFFTESGYNTTKEKLFLKSDMNNKTPVAFQLRTYNDDGIYYDYIKFDDVDVDNGAGWMDSGSGPSGPSKRIFNISLPTNIFNLIFGETYSWKSMSDSTGGNGDTQINIVNQYYKSNVTKVNYSADFMKTRIGGSPTAGFIDKVAFFVLEVPQYPLPNFNIYLQNYSGSVDSANNSSSSDWSNMYSSSSYTVSAGRNEFVFASPFHWTGGNISIASSFTRVPNYSRTGINHATPPINGQARGWYSWSDSRDMTISTSVDYGMPNIPVWHFHFSESDDGVVQSPDEWIGSTLSS
jgi:hypothetical protein